MAGIAQKLPSDAHGHVITTVAQQNMPVPSDIFYLDASPIGAPLLAIASPAVAYKVTQEHSLPKWPVLGDYVDPMAGSHNLVTLEGQEWKKWRNVFNSGFSAGHMITLVPGIVKDAQTFCDVLQYHVEKNDMFQMEELATRLTVDIIGRVVLYVSPGFDALR